MESDYTMGKCNTCGKMDALFKGRCSKCNSNSNPVNDILNMFK